jgi:hypothetical protein
LITTSVSHTGFSIIVTTIQVLFIFHEKYLTNIDGFQKICDIDYLIENVIKEKKKSNI